MRRQRQDLFLRMRPPPLPLKTRHPPLPTSEAEHFVAVFVAGRTHFNCRNLRTGNCEKIELGLVEVAGGVEPISHLTASERVTVRFEIGSVEVAGVAETISTPATSERVTAGSE